MATQFYQTCTNKIVLCDDCYVTIVYYAEVYL